MGLWAEAGENLCRIVVLLGPDAPPADGPEDCRRCPGCYRPVYESSSSHTLISPVSVFGLCRPCASGATLRSLRQDDVPVSPQQRTVLETVAAATAQQPSRRLRAGEAAVSVAVSKVTAWKHIAGWVGGVAGVAALVYAHPANRHAGKANDIATEANAKSDESNRIAGEANQLAEEANVCAQRSDARSTERDDVRWEGDWTAPTRYEWSRRVRPQRMTWPPR